MEANYININSSLFIIISLVYKTIFFIYLSEAFKKRRYQLYQQHE